MNYFKDSFFDLVRSPWLAVPVAVLIISLSKIGGMSKEVLNQLNEGSKIIFVTSFSVFAMIFLMSLIFSFLIIFSHNIIKRKAVFHEFIKREAGLIIPNFIVMIIVLAFSGLALGVVFMLSFFIGKFFSLSSQAADFIFFLFYCAALLGFLIFLSLSSFVLVIKRKSPFQSIKSSSIIVWKNYPTIILTFIFSFILFYLIELLPYLIYLIFSSLLTSFLSLFFTRIVENDI